MEEPKGKRSRGMVLSASGVQRLSQAIGAAEIKEKRGDRFTMAELSERTGISTSTLSRLWTSKTGVDRRTLRLLFSAFQLDLTDGDVQQSQAAGHSLTQRQRTVSQWPSQTKYPSGPVPLDSVRYIRRLGIDDRALQEVTQPGCVIRIKAPRGFGKTSLLIRLVHHATQLSYATAQIDLQQAETSILATPSQFLRWLCTVLSAKLGLEADPNQCWDKNLGSNLSTTVYVREFILAQLQRPLVLAINEVNQIFEYPETAKNLFPLLRSWHEEAQHDALWRNLRLVVVYSTDVYLPLDINQSPFNIGLPLFLPEFTRNQVQTLASLYNLPGPGEMCDRLFSLVGGHPLLVSIALYHLQNGVSLDELLNTATTHDSVFRNCLQQALVQIHQNPTWAESIRPLITGEKAIALDPVLAYQLEGLGIIKPAADGWQMSCELYRIYFKNNL